jgi:hypothetical protein
MNKNIPNSDIFLFNPQRYLCSSGINRSRVLHFLCSELKAHVTWSDTAISFLVRCCYFPYSQFVQFNSSCSNALSDASNHGLVLSPCLLRTALTVLHYMIGLHCTALHYTKVHCTILHYNAQVASISQHGSSRVCQL